jgi:lipid II:glycine glycyltransferase (peptidoglycan interpeptide bridge formation enzyme)
MTSFLHSAAWERLQVRAGHAPVRHDEQLYLREHTPLGDYYLGSRLAFGAKDELPQLPNKPGFLRLEPSDLPSLERIKTFGRLIPTHAIQPRQTSLVALGDNQSLLASFQQKHRYNLRLAEKKGIEVATFSQNASIEIHRFWDLLTATAGRQSFRTHGREYYQMMAEELEKDGMIHLLVATHEGDDLAAMLLITHGDTGIYLHGASSDTKKNLMAPYLMHWQAMLLAREIGCTTYDLWGTDAVYDTGAESWEPRVGAASAGVTRMKLGFGGNIVDYPGTFDLILNPFWYNAYITLRRLRGNKRAFA